MKTYKITFPDRIQLSPEQIKQFVLAKLYEDDICSAGFCALALGIDKQDFIRLLGKYEVMYLAAD